MVLTPDLSGGSRVQARCQLGLVSSEGLAGAGGAAPSRLTHMAVGKMTLASGRRPRFLTTPSSQHPCLPYPTGCTLFSVRGSYTKVRKPGGEITGGHHTCYLYFISDKINGSSNSLTRVHPGLFCEGGILSGCSLQYSREALLQGPAFR